MPAAAIGPGIVAALARTARLLRDDADALLTAGRLGIWLPPTGDRLVAYRVGRDMAFAAICGLIAASVIARVLMTIPGVPTPPTGFAVNGLHNLAVMLIASVHAGVTEELVLVGVLVTVLEAARRPVWEIYATSLLLRVALHLYFGLAAPAALAMATTNVWLFRRTRRLLPLVVAHVAVDQLGALQVVAGPGNHDDDTESTPMEDRSAAQIAAEIAAGAPGWVVMWSPWRRCFTAFAACTPQRTILDEPNPARLVAWMRSVQRAAGRAEAMASPAGVPPSGAQ